MFNPATLATEIFGILRSFDYVVNIFDYEGNRVYEPSEARRFFATPKNITVSIHEEGENSIVKMFLSNSVNVIEVEGLISTMRITASKFGVLFNVRKYERDLSPKDLAPNGAADIESGVSLSSVENPSRKFKSPEFDFKRKRTKIEAKLDDIEDSASDLIDDVKRANSINKTKVKESMEIITETAETVNLGILGVDVEADAWERFKKGYLTFDAVPDSVSDDDVEKFSASYGETHGASVDYKTARSAVELTSVIAAIKKSSPLLATAFEKAMELFVTGSAARVINALVDKAINARAYGADEKGEFHDVPDNDGTPDKKDFVTVKEFSGKVERQAWQDFVNEYIDLSSDINFDVKVGASANKLALFLHLVAEKTKSAGLANMLASFANDIEEGRGSPFKEKVAKHAIDIAQGGKVDVSESIIMTESVKAFADWFDSLSSASIFENAAEEEIDQEIIEEVEEIEAIEECPCEDNENLSTEDVLLPSDENEDFVSDVTSGEVNDEELERMISFAKGNTGRPTVRY